MNNNGLTILHAEPLFVVVEKPGGLLAVPGRGPDMQDCVVARLKARFPDCITQPAVHRLDMDTSGLMLLALTTAAHRILCRQFEARSVEKRYIAVLEGVIAGEAGEISLPFRLDPDNRPYQVYDPVHGKIGVSRWRKLRVEGTRTRVEFMPLTGRTHQLRLHAANEHGLGAPIVGDRLYGNRQPGERMLLHAAALGFQHPESGAPLTFTSPPPF